MLQKKGPQGQLFFLATQSTNNPFLIDDFSRASRSCRKPRSSRAGGNLNYSQRCYEMGAITAVSNVLQTGCDGNEERGFGITVCRKLELKPLLS